MPKKGGAAAEAAPKSAGKTKGSFPTRDERAAAALADINKKLKGRAVLMRASDYRLPYLTKRLPTGLLTVDSEIGGGFPAGGISQLIGRRNAGKTMLMWMVVRQLQHLLGKKMKVLLAMTEIPADRDQARKLGVKISMGDADIEAMSKARKDNGWPPFSKEELAYLRDEVGQIDELHALTAQDFYDAILRVVEDNVYHLIVIDSIGNILDAAEAENESVHDKTYGGISGVNTTFLKKMTNLLTMPMENGMIRDTCLIGINQVRDNIKDPNKNYKAPGGNALEHAKLLDIYVESGKVLGEEKFPVYTPEGWKQRFVAYGKEVNWKIEKGKAGIHEGSRGTFVYKFCDLNAATGESTPVNNVDYYSDTLMAGVKYGAIETNGAWIQVPNPESPGTIYAKVQGRDAFLEHLRQDAASKASEGKDDESLMNIIRDLVFKKAGINIDYNWES